MVDTLGAFKLPVEVVQYGADRIFREFEKKVTNHHTVWRMANAL